MASVGHRVQLRYARAVHGNDLSRPPTPKRVGDNSGSVRRGAPRPDRVRLGCDLHRGALRHGCGRLERQQLEVQRGSRPPRGAAPPVGQLVGGGGSPAWPLARRTEFSTRPRGTGRAYSSSPPPASCPSGPTTAGRSHSWSPIRLRNSAAGTFRCRRGRLRRYPRTSAITVITTTSRRAASSDSSTRTTMPQPGTSSWSAPMERTGGSIAPPPGVCCPQLPRLSRMAPRSRITATRPRKTAMAEDTKTHVGPTDLSGVATDAGEIRAMTRWPVWAPDGTSIAVVKSAPGTVCGPGSLHAVNADGTDQITLAPARGA